jgi:cobalamin biosynthesis protein CbiG
VVVVAENDVLPDMKPGALALKTRRIFAGVGCRKGVSYEEVRDAVRSALAGKDLHIHNLRGLASIDIKNGEHALYKAADNFGVSIALFAADDLDKVAPNKSDFVKEKVGADGVCEPAAILASKGGKLILPKTVYGRITVALAEEE